MVKVFFTITTFLIFLVVTRTASECNFFEFIHKCTWFFSWVIWCMHEETMSHRLEQVVIGTKIILLHLHSEEQLKVAVVTFCKWNTYPEITLKRLKIRHFRTKQNIFKVITLPDVQPHEFRQLLRGRATYS